MAGKKSGCTNLQTKESLSSCMACKLTNVAYEKYLPAKGPEGYLVVGISLNLRGSMSQVKPSSSPLREKLTKNVHPLGINF